MALSDLFIYLFVHESQAPVTWSSVVRCIGRSQPSVVSLVSSNFFSGDPITW